ncbi:DNA translocase FtsK 4TM domain-containing protein [Psychrobacter sp. 72-O-c]|uniref:DNA translocase FtsK 4TM domain-containing protein n=1 Tax=Psychrobacter sp. 72-O-c TaxID=2774125 RepID=UPI00191AE335|nr:DNA translocase FtsK 4TM domain-containing protein [Psychrobacter sp. 72-O-c]
MISAPLIEYLKKGIFTLLGLILAVYLFIILLTYTGNDPSWSHISSDMTTINNMGGAMGAWLSDLLYSFFGFGAWWLLAFLVYESVLIWWDNEPTFWLLRLVTYVFLILSVSALFAQLVALIQQVSDPVATGLEGVAGGIIGLELQARLAQLLSQWGSVAFLVVFVIVTATFAFNIHWLVLYHKLTNLAWFDSGVKAEDSVQNPAQTGQENDATQQRNAIQQNTKSLLTDDEDATNENAQREKPDYGQLPLELQSDHNSHNGNQASDNSGRFSDVLTDFLAKSGLGASVKASMAAAAAKNAMNDGLQTAASTPNSHSTNFANDSHSAATASNPTAATVRKVEPSFAWNDAGTVDNLLANGSMTEQNVSAPSSYNNAKAPSNVELSNTSATQVESLVPVETSTADLNSNHEEGSVQQASNEVVANTTTAEPHTLTSNVDSSSVDSLADAWLAEHAPAPVAVPSEFTESENAPSTIAQPALKTPLDSATDLSAEVTNVNESSELPNDSEPLISPKVPSASQVASIVSAAPASTSHSHQQEPSAVADMTPTNTPPANPKATPTVASTNSGATANQSTRVETVIDPKSTFSFAVADGDSSNHITDMMPEDDRSSDDDLHTPVMPEIHDDDAFSQRSRSMQTAKYRDSLSAIPAISILDKPDPNRQPSYTLAELEQLSELLEIKLQDFNVKAEVVNAIPGPVVTRFEVELAAGVKASKVTGISRDLARSLSMASLRVVEVIPGKPYIGIEVPNKKREMVRLIELIDTEKFNDPKAQISMAMGKDIGGKAIITDLARAPHMLVAGTTGSGKSVLVNAMLLSMLLKYTPSELRLILIDPKQLELANYNDIPHLLTPVVTDMTEAASSLSWCVAEMERRYQLMSLLKVRKLDEFNKKVRAAEKAGNPMLDPLWRPNDNVSISQAPKLKTLPMIVIVADEFADMIMQVGKQAEELITRLAQKSRAAGIHLILATQRPSVDVITGLIKANIPVRAALRVNSKVDSRTILDSGGAEDMLGNGDMLFLGPGQIEPDRVHGAYVSDEEVNSICDAWRERGAPDYIDNMAGNFELSSPGGSTGSPSGEDDDLYNDAVGFIMETRKVSASSIQRKFSIGYNRAARIVDSMEEAGLVSSMGKSGKRELLM